MVTASAGRADKGSSRGSRAFRAPLQRDRLAAGGQGRGEEKLKARQPSSCAQTQGATMSDPEIEELRDKMHCAVVLERHRRHGRSTARRARSSASNTGGARARS